MKIPKNIGLVGFLFLFPLLFNISKQGLSPIVSFCFAGMYLLVGIIYFPKKFFNKKFLGFYLLIFFTLIGFLRKNGGNFLATIYLSFIVISYLFFFMVYMKRNGSISFLKYLLIGGVFYILFTYQAYTLGFRAITDRLTGLEESSFIKFITGFSVYETYYPFTETSNGHYSLSVSIMYLLGLWFLSIQKKVVNKLIIYILLVFILFYMASLGVTTALISLLLGIIMLKISVKVKKHLILVIILMPLIMMGVPYFTYVYQVEFATIFGTNQAATFNGRSVFWGVYLQTLLSFKVEHFIGYGVFGNTVVDSYHSLVGIVDRGYGKLYTLHNIYLQMIFDYGYMFFLFFLFFFKKTLKKIVYLCEVTNNYLYEIIFSIFFLFFISTSLESFWGTYNRYGLILVLGLIYLIETDYFNLKKKS